MKRIVVSAVAVLCALVLRATPAEAASSLGAITPQGYFPPSGVTVIWRIAGQADVTKRLDPSVLFTSLGDVAGFLCRYAECDQTVVGRQIVPFVTSEHGGGEGFAILQELFRQAGLARDPSLQEAYDWMIANGGGRALFTCSDFIGFTGHARPGCQDIAPGGTGGSKLRPQPNDPPGCCAVTLPCIVRNETGRANGEEWTEAVQTPGGGRIGCRLHNVTEGGPQEPPGPGEPPVTPPVCPPVDAAACVAFTKPIRAALTTCQGEKTALTTRVQDLNQSLAASQARVQELDQLLATRQTEITTLKARVAELEGRKLDTLDTTRFTAALQGMNRPGQVTIRPRAAQEIQATTDFLRSLHQRQCLAAPVP